MRTIILFLALASCLPALADSPAYEYFVIKRDRVPAAIKSDEGLLSLPPDQLVGISEVQGWVESIEKCTVSFSSKKFRLDLRAGFGLSLPDSPKSLNYLISAGSSHDWGIISTQGQATQVGASFLTRSWQKQKFVVIFRPINLKR